MDRRKLLKHLTYLIFFIFIINTLALKLYWYSLIWWFDMPMHFMGGFFIGLLWMFVFPPKDLSFKSILKIILGVLFIGILWEVFEVFLNNYTVQNPFDMIDTLSDIFFDFVGGIFSFFYFSKRIINIKASPVGQEPTGYGRGKNV